jgi:hypothetical protein
MEINGNILPCLTAAEEDRQLEEGRVKYFVVQPARAGPLSDAARSFRFHVLSQCVAEEALAVLTRFHRSCWLLL